jgi:hypothetical protein
MNIVESIKNIFSTTPNIEHKKYRGIRAEVNIPVIILDDDGEVLKTINAGIGDKIIIDGNENVVDMNTREIWV